MWDSLPVSDAGKWSVCPLYMYMKWMYTIPEDPNNPNESRLDGLAVHSMLEGTFYHGTQYAEGEVVNERIVTEDMIDFHEEFFKHIQTLPPGTMEEKFAVPSVHEKIKGRWDFVAYAKDQNILYIVDAKYGRTYVDEWNNAQLILTAEGFIDKYNINTTGLVIVLTIIQTRCYNEERVRTQRTSYEALRPIVNEIRRVAPLTQMQPAPANPGKTCKDCPGRHACSANRQVVWSDIDNMQTRVTKLLEPEEAAKELAFLENQKALLDARVTGLQAQVEFNIRNGKSCSFYGMEKGKQGRLKWKVGLSVIKTLGQVLGKCFVEEKAITPTQALKLIPKESHVLIENHQIAVREPGQDKIVRITAHKFEKMTSTGETL